MDQTNELFNTLSEEEIAAYTADPGTEPHIVIDKDRFVHVPEELRRIAVEGDHNIETVTFDCPRYWDKHDLSKMIIYIRYACPNSEPGGYVAQNVRLDSSSVDVIHFEWTISENVTAKAGSLAFAVVAKKSDAETGESLNRWHSEPNTEMYISKGIPGDTVDYTTGNDDLLTQVLLLKEAILGADFDNIGGNANIDVTAKVGQTITVKAVDDYNKPTEWEAVDYQSKTHWSEVVEDGTVIPLTTVKPTIEGFTGQYAAIVDPFDLKEGVTYSIVCDGVTYTCVAKSVDFDYPYIGVGNHYYLSDNIADNTGEPFLVAHIPYFNDMYAAMFFMNTATEHTLSVDVKDGHLLPLTKFKASYESSLGTNVARLPVAKFEVGKTYTVVYDDVTYVCEAKAVKSGNTTFVGIGNNRFFGGKQTTEPFAVAYDVTTNMTGIIPLTDTESVHSVQITGEKTVYHKIPREYLYSKCIKFSLGGEDVPGYWNAYTYTDIRDIINDAENGVFQYATITFPMQMDGRTDDIHLTMPLASHETFTRDDGITVHRVQFECEIELDKRYIFTISMIASPESGVSISDLAKKVPEGGEGEWELIVDEAEINEDVQEIEFSGIDNYNDFLFMGKFKGGNTSGFYLKINGRQVSPGFGNYFVHNHDKFNVTKLRIDKKRLYYQISSTSQQLDSAFNLDELTENKYGQTHSRTEPITRFSFVLAKTESYFKAGSTYSLWGRKIANV